MSLNNNNQLNPAEDDESALYHHESVSPPTQSSANPRRTLIDDMSMFNFLGPQFCLPRNNPDRQVSKTVPEIIYSQPVHNDRPQLVEPVNGNLENFATGIIPNPLPRSKLPETSTPNGSTGFDPIVTVPTPPPRTKLPGTSKVNHGLFDSPVPIPTTRNTFPSTASDEMTTNFELLASGIDTRKASSDPTIRQMLDMGCTVEELIANGLTRNDIARSGIDIDAHSSENSDEEESSTEELTAETKIFAEIQGICEAQAASFDFGQMSESIYETIADQEPTGCQGLILWQENDKNPPEVCWAMIEASKLIICQNSDRRHVLTMDGLKSLISVGDLLEDIVEPPNKYRFEILMTGWQTSGRTLITPSQAERSTWQQWILRASTCPFDSNLTESFTRAGTVFIKENVSGEWRRSWILLNMEQKTLHRQYLDVRAQTISEVFVADLRKIRGISLIFNSGLEHEFAQNATGTCIVLTWSGFALYIESILKSETEKWLLFFERTVGQSIRSLADKQLTDDNIPVFVDKCLQFIELHGLRSLGIYRRNAVQSKATKLADELEKKCSFHILPDQYDEHDCATVLKRFFRELSEPLLDNTDEWIEASKLDPNIRLTTFKTLIADMPEVNRQVLKRLLHHFSMLNDYQDSNGASVANLAAIWAPNLLRSGGDSDYLFANACIQVLTALITDFKQLYDVDWAAEQEKTSIQNAMQKTKGQIHRSHSRDFIMWIKNKVSDKELHFMITPQMEAIEMAEKLALETTRYEGVNFMLLEIVYGGYMFRPIQRNELLIDIFLKWSTWKPNECRDNHLCFKMDEFLHAGLCHIKQFGRRRHYSVHWCTASQKKYKNGMVEFVDNHMIFKSTDKGLVPLKTKQSIKLEVSKQNCYFGYDPIRTPPNKWNLTFISKAGQLPGQRLAFGLSVSFPTENDYWQFILFVFCILYPQGNREIFY